jgi:predicted membrane protein
MMMRGVAHIVVFTISAAIAALTAYLTAFILGLLWVDLLMRIYPNHFLKYFFSISYLCGAFLIISYEVYAVFYPLRRIFYDNRPEL